VVRETQERKHEVGQEKIEDDLSVDERADSRGGDEAQESL
jgi:hypothetical protein